MDPTPKDNPMSDKIALERRYGATNYDPLPIVLARGDGVWLYDEEGRRYLDMLSAYSAVSFGYGHPKLVKVLAEQAQRLAITSRAFHSERLGPFLARLCELTGHGPRAAMTDGRRGRGDRDQVRAQVGLHREGRAEGPGRAHRLQRQLPRPDLDHRRALRPRPQYRDGFGPYAAGTRHVPFGDARALEAAITANTAAFLVEPVQGEGRHRRAARGLPHRMRAHLPRPQRASSSWTRCKRASAAPASSWRATTRA
jgi:ornithine--oxo-acid transaminase